MNDTANGEYEILIEEILKIEVEMFLSVATKTDPECRSRVNDMRLHRSSQFAGWSLETVRSYLGDLEKAVAADENLMTLKYARMEGRISPLSLDPRISEILEAYVAWQISFIENYPNVMRGGRDLDDFRRYLGGELETYSSRTLKLLKKDVDVFEASGRSMTVDIYERMARLAGYSSLAEMESSFTEQ